MRMRWVAVVALLLGQVDPCSALEPGKRLEQYVLTTWTVDRGLPQSTVLGITQTPDGYIWIGTQEGFVRFDGAQFVTYDRNAWPQLISNITNTILATRDGTLYVGTVDGGLVRVRGDKVEVLTEANGLPDPNVTALQESRDGSIWIGTGAGLARLTDGVITKVPFELPGVAITALAEDKSGQLWVATDNGLATIDGDRVNRRTEQDGFPSQVVLSLEAGGDGSMWIGSEGGGLVRHYAGRMRVYGTAQGLPSLAVSAVHEDRNGTIWIGTPDRGFGRLRNDRFEFDSERQDPIISFFEDREGNMWIGRASGLDQLSDGVVVTYAKSEGLPDNDVKSIAADRRGKLYVGTRRGASDLQGDHLLTAANGLSSSNIRTLWPARDGSLWIGTADAGLNHVRGNRTTTFTTKDGLPGDTIMALLEDRRGVLWVGTVAGLARIIDGRVDRNNLPVALLAEPVSSLYEGLDGSIWIGTYESGVTRIHPGGATNVFTTADGLANNFIVAVHEDTSGTIWLGTVGGGLNRLKNGRIVPITTRHGLQDDSVFAILEDRHGNLWMSCNRGIFRASLAHLNAVADGRRERVLSVIYGRTDGMKTRECNGGTQPVAWEAPDGTLWFATTGGAAAIHPDKALAGAAVSPVKIVDIFADHTKLAAGAPVPPGQRTLEFHYTSPTFRAPDKLRFLYMLEGFDTEWTDAQRRRVAYYTNVPPGSYQFHVRVVNGEGVASAPSTVALDVQPLFHQTWLFWMLVAIALVSAAWIAHRWRLRVVRASAERFRLLFDRNLAGVYRAEINGRLLDCNQAALSILGLTSEGELGDRSIFEFYTKPSDADELIARLRADGAVSGVETALKRTDGTPIWVLQNVSLAKAAPGQEVLEATIIDLTDRKEAEEKIRYQAFHDALTDLPNRTLFKDRLSLAVTYAERRGRQVGVLFLDLDRFKLINDTLGHTIGDHLLQGIGERLRGVVREEDSVARVGGDEFTILLMDLARPADAMVVAQKILDAVARPITVDGHELFVTCSIGIAMSPADGVDAETLLKNADNALYRAKEAGKNNYQLCTPSMTQLAAERLALENALRQGLDRSEFRVLYQPQFDLKTRSVVAVEALLRWDRPGVGIVGPSEFIAAAEESRLIVPIGEFVLEAAMQQAKEWGEEYPLRIAVNVSAAQFRQRTLVRAIRNALQEYGVEPARLEVEITESTAMQNPAVTAEILHELKRLGVCIVIDDFGIGHSSLNYLKRFPIDGLKIDRAFVQDMMSDTSDAGIVSAVIAMAQALNLRVTAEGVETEQQLAFLESRGCSSIQGYLLSRPVTAEAVTTLLRSGTALTRAALPHSA